MLQCFIPWRIPVRLAFVAGDGAEAFLSSFLLALDTAAFTLDTLGHMEIVPRAQGHAQLTISTTVKLTISKNMSLCSCYLSRGNRCFIFQRRNTTTSIYEAAMTTITMPRILDQG
jgi:hypothetical protein